MPFTKTKCGMAEGNKRPVPAQCIIPGDVFDAEPLYEWFEHNGFEYDEGDRMCAEAEAEVVESVTVTTGGYTVIITTGSVFYSVPTDHLVPVCTS